MPSLFSTLFPPLLAFAVMLLLIVRGKFHPFLALIIAAACLGAAAGLAPIGVVKSFQKGFGDVLSSVGLVVGLGTMLGSLMLSSGGADRIAHAFLRLGSKAWIPTAICAAALLIGLPHLFDVSFVMLVPLVYAIAARSSLPLLTVAIPMAAGLYTSHGLLPPHPAPTMAMNAYQADPGRTIFYGLLIAIPMAALTGPLFTRIAMRWLPATIPPPGGPTGAPAPQADSGKTPPALASVLITVLLPPGLMMMRTFSRMFFPAGQAVYDFWELVGDPLVSLLISVLFAMYVLGRRCGFTSAEIRKQFGQGFASAAGVILILGAGGGFKEILAATGIGKAIAVWSLGWHLSPLVVAWAVAALIRTAIGSATVATVTAAGIIAPLAAAHGGVSRELLVLATATGSLMLSHVNDSGFWLFKEYLHLTVPETLKSWTVLVSLQSVLGLVMVLILNTLVG